MIDGKSSWPAGLLTRVPYWVYQDPAVYRAEQRQIFEGPVSITTAENHREGLPAGIVYADSRAMLEDRVTALRQANVYERHRYRHIIGGPAIVSRDSAATRTETGVLARRSARPVDGVESQCFSKMLVRPVRSKARTS